RDQAVRVLPILPVHADPALELGGAQRRDESGSRLSAHLHRTASLHGHPPEGVLDGQNIRTGISGEDQLSERDHGYRSCVPSTISEPLSTCAAGGVPLVGPCPRQQATVSTPTGSPRS